MPAAERSAARIAGFPRWFGFSRLFKREALPAFKPAGPAPSVSKGPARGVVERGGKTRVIVVRVDDETFDRVRRGADASGVTVTEAVRQLLARGLDANEGGR